MILSYCDICAEVTDFIADVDDDGYIECTACGVLQFIGWEPEDDGCAD